MNQVQEGAESILHHAKPTEPVNLTFWQTCKAHPWLASTAGLVFAALVAIVIVFALGLDIGAKKADATPIATVAVQTEAVPELVSTVEAPLQPHAKPSFTAKNHPKKIAPKAINTPATGANSGDILGDFIADLEHKNRQTKEPAQSATSFEQDFETRLFNFERLIP